MSSIARRGSAMEAGIRGSTMPSRMRIDITLKEDDSERGPSLRSYSTMDEIRGEIIVTSRLDTPVSAVEIDFVGVTRTYVDKLTSTSAIHGRQDAVHRFLRLVQPRHTINLPPDGILLAGKSYIFPFQFVVPSHLLPAACAHLCENSSLKEAHLQLPPSLGNAGQGEATTYHRGNRWQDDLAPEMAKIAYMIKVKLSKNHNDIYVNPIIAEAARTVRIAPSVEEQPPLNIDNQAGDEYILRLRKTIRKGFMKGKLGTLTMTSSQPKSFRHPTKTNQNDTPTVSTMTKVQLRFDPEHRDALPPRLSTISSRIKATTFFADKPRTSFPVKHSGTMDTTQGHTAEVVNLGHMCIAAVEWRRHYDEVGDDHEDSSGTELESDAFLPRRGSTMSNLSNLSGRTTNSSASSSSSCTRRPSQRNGLPVYTANILVPLTLPKQKYFVPTFHSCIASRVYALSLSLALDGQPLLRSLVLKVPVQVSAAGGAFQAEVRRRSEQATLAYAAAERFFEPRSMAPLGMDGDHPVGDDVGGNINEHPPGYDALPAYSSQQAHVTALQ